MWWKRGNEKNRSNLGENSTLYLYLNINFIFISSNGSSLPKDEQEVIQLYIHFIITLWSCLVQFSSVTQSCRLFATPWTAARQASLSITNSWIPTKPMYIESVMASNHLILCCPLLLQPSIFPSIRVFSNQSALPIRWPKYWSFRFNISSSNEHSGLISIRMDWLDLLQSKGL